MIVSSQPIRNRDYDISLDMYEENCLSGQPHGHPLQDAVERRRQSRKASMTELRHALEFFDKVMSASHDEQTAVGTDHYDRLILAARKAVI